MVGSWAASPGSGSPALDGLNPHRPRQAPSDDVADMADVMSTLNANDPDARRRVALRAPPRVAYDDPGRKRYSSFTVSLLRHRLRRYRPDPSTTAACILKGRGGVH